MGKKLIEKAEKSKEQYSAAARLLLEVMDDDFPLEEFEEFVKKNIFIIGTNYINTFLDYKDKLKRAQREKLAPSLVPKPIPNHNINNGI